MRYLIALCLIGLDQLTKLAVVQCLKGEASVPVIPHILSFTYVENRGIAFGLFQGKNFIFIPLALITIGICIFFLEYFHKRNQRWMVWGLTLIIAGAAGNLVDKVLWGYVVDFIQIKLFDFPVFNVADIFVCIGTLLAVVYILFMDTGGKKHADSK